jgi:hypothetical protein
MNSNIERVENYLREKGIKVRSSCYPDDWQGPAEYNVYFEQRRAELLEKQGWVRKSF